MKTVHVYRIVKNATKAAGRVVQASVKGEPVLVTPETQSERQAICAVCQYNLRGRCSICGCCTTGRILNKTRLATEKCPAGRWPPRVTG